MLACMFIKKKDTGLWEFRNSETGFPQGAHFVDVLPALRPIVQSVMPQDALLQQSRSMMQVSLFRVRVRVRVRFKFRV